MTAIQRRIVLFFLVTYALSWFGHLGNWLLPGPYWPLPMNPLGPIIAAPLVLWFAEGSAGPEGVADGGSASSAPRSGSTRWPSSFRSRIILASIWLAR